MAFQYHLVWVPTYRHRILLGEIANEIAECIKAFSEQKGIKILHMNIQSDHIHLIRLIIQNYQFQNYCGIVKGRTAIRIFNKFQNLKKKPYGGNHF